MNTVKLLYDAWGGHLFGLCLQVALVTLAGALTWGRDDDRGRTHDTPPYLARIAEPGPATDWTEWET